MKNGDALPAGNVTKTVQERLLVSLVSYAGLMLLDSEMFTRDVMNASSEDMVRMLEADSRITRSLPPSFLSRMCSAFDEETLHQIFLPLFQSIMKHTLTTDLSFSSASRCLRALSLLSSHKETASVVISPPFLPNSSIGRQFEKFSLVGPLFSLFVNEHHPLFSSLSSRDASDVENQMNSMRIEHKVLQQELFSLFNGLVRSGTVTRNSVVSWFSRVCLLNKQRQKSRYDPLSVSSDGFFFNASVVALDLCRPMWRGKKDKYHTVSLLYTLRESDLTTNRHGMEEDVRIGVSAVELKKRMEQEEKKRESEEKERENEKDTPSDSSSLSPSPSPSPSPNGEFNFPSSIFFLTHDLIRLGVTEAMARATRSAVNIERAREAMQAAGSDPIQASHARASRDIFLGQFYHLSVQLKDREYLSLLSEFMEWTCKWLLSLSLSQDPLLPCVPEFILQNVVNYQLWLARCCRDVIALTGLSTDGLLPFLVKFMNRTDLVKNPHLRGQFPQILCLWIPSSSSPPLSDREMEIHAFATNKDTLPLFVPALISLFVDIEFGPTDFYEKFAVRNRIAELLEFLWRIPHHRSTFLSELQKKESFLRFSNAICNDLTYLLEEGLKHLSDIRDDQDDMVNWPSLPEDERARREQSFTHNERNATELMRLAHATVHMLFYLTDESKGGTTEPFVQEDLVERVAHMVDFFLNRLVGPQVEELKVKNREKYGFKPKQLLSEIVSIFISLSRHTSFREAVVADVRSYDKDVFSKGLHIVRKRGLVYIERVNEFELILKDLETRSEGVKNDEEKLGEIPEEFLDPYMYTLMRNPVILPRSQQRMDRAVVIRHLMNDPLDPFTRQPFTKEELVPDEELQAKIDAFIKERLG